MRAEDDEMSNALMNDMADALRSAGLGSMVHSNELNLNLKHHQKRWQEDQKCHRNSSVEDLTVEEQVQSLIEEGEYKSRSNAPQEALLPSTKQSLWIHQAIWLVQPRCPSRSTTGCSRCTQAFQICLDLNPDHAPATANLAILLDRIGDDAGAAAMARRGLEFFPGHPSLTDVLNRTKSAPVEEVPDEIETTVTKATTKNQRSTLLWKKPELRMQKPFSPKLRITISTATATSTKRS